MSKHRTLPASTAVSLLVTLLLVSPVTLAQQPVQTAPGGGQPAAGGKGPGMGHDYRRNVGGAGMGLGQMPAAGLQPFHLPQEQRLSSPPPMPGAAPPAPSSGQPQQAAPAMAPYRYGMQRYGRPGRQGYGYPGYRGRGGSSYPGHRQYGNPPGVPSPLRKDPATGCN